MSTAIPFGAITAQPIALEERLDNSQVRNPADQSLPQRYLAPSTESTELTLNNPARAVAQTAIAGIALAVMGMSIGGIGNALPLLPLAQSLFRDENGGSIGMMKRSEVCLLGVAYALGAILPYAVNSYQKYGAPLLGLFPY